MKHFRVVEQRLSGVVYTGLCGNTSQEALEEAESAFPQYSNMKAIECNCEAWNGKCKPLPDDWTFPF